MSIMNLHFLRYMNKMMKMFITIFFLMLFSQSWVKADDITDLQIEGIGIGDSLLNFHSKKYLTKKKNYVYRGGKEFKEYSKIILTEGSEIYEQRRYYFKSDDEKFLVTGISAKNYYKNNISECYDDQKIIANEIESTIDFFDKRTYPKSKVDAYPDGNSYITQIWLEISGGVIGINCYDWSSKDNPHNIDMLSIAIFTDDYNKFLDTNF